MTYNMFGGTLNLI